MATVDLFLRLGIVDLAGADIAIEDRVGEAEVVLVRLAAEAVDRGLLHQNLGQTEITAHGLDLLNRQMRQGAEIAGCVAVAGGVAHPVLGEVAGIDHAAVAALADGIDRCHADARGQVHDALVGEGQSRRDRIFDALHGVVDIDLEAPDAQMVAEQVGHINIELLAVRHQNADDPVLAERLNADGGGHGAVLAAGNAQNGVAVGAVFRKEVPDPSDALSGHFFNVKHFYYTS